MKRAIVVAIIIFAAVIVLYPRRPEGVYRVKDGDSISFERMVRDLRSADVVFVGELHDAPAHHRFEARIIRALHESGVPMTVGLEMFRADDQKALDAWIAGDLDRDRFIRRYYANWSFPWSLYADIFHYARERRIPLVGLNIPDKIGEAVAKNGFASLTREQKAAIPAAISCNVGPRYREFIRQAYTDHVLKSHESFDHFCEAQLLWDESMAWNIAEYRALHKDRLVVVMTGVGHAWRRGIPEQLTKFAKLRTRVVMPWLPDENGPDALSGKDADYIVRE